MIQLTRRPETIRSHLAFLAPTIPALLLVAAFYFVIRQGETNRIVRVITQGLEVLVRTTVSSIIVALLVVVIAVGLAVLFVEPWLRSRRAAVLAVCIFGTVAVAPVLLGAASFGFLWRTPFADWLMNIPIVANRGPIGVGTIDVFAQLLRYFPIATWLLILAILETSATTRLYARYSGMGAVDLVRAEFFRRWLAPTFIVAAFAYQDAFNDYIITYLSIRPSEATNSELISHFLSRTFVSLAIARSASDASSALVGLSLVAAIVSAVSFALTASIIFFGIRSMRFSALRRTLWRWPDYTNDLPRRLSWLPAAVAALIVASLVIKIASLEARNFAAVWDLRYTIAISLSVALVCWVLAALANFCVREARLESDGSAQRGFLRLAWISVSLGFIPPLGLAGAIYFIFLVAGFGQLPPTVGWFLAQVLRMFPLFVVLLIPTSLALNDGSTWYLRINGVGFWRRLYELFISPFLSTHIAVLIIGWNFVLNEGVVSTVFQADIPAFSEIVQRASSGRSAVYPLAGALTTLNFLLFGSLCLIWGIQSYVSWARTNAES